MGFKSGIFRITDADMMNIKLRSFYLYKKSIPNIESVELAVSKYLFISHMITATRKINERTKISWN